MSMPTEREVAAITAVTDPVVRNLQITWCYYELSRAFARTAGSCANWCTFATWASKQAGQTIRGEDLVRAFEERLGCSRELADLLQLAAARAAEALEGDSPPLARRVLDLLDPAAAFRRAADAVARGNLKVFEEIGRHFARYLETFPESADGLDHARMTAFCASFREGDPPEGQECLRRAFIAYAEARVDPDPDARSELVFLGNLLVGYHEQTRLQPEIAEALDAFFGDPEALRRNLLALLLPGFWIRFRHRIARLFGVRLPLDRALDRLLGAARRAAREAITDALMTLSIAGERLRLGDDLRGRFPPPLQAIASTALRDLLDRCDPTSGSLSGTAARDWADFDDRMHFITDLFRCCQEQAPLFDQPFTPDQVEALRAGRMPGGDL